MLFVYSISHSRYLAGDCDHIINEANCRTVQFFCVSCHLLLISSAFLKEPYHSPYWVHLCICRPGISFSEEDLSLPVVSTLKKRFLSLFLWNSAIDVIFLPFASLLSFLLFVGAILHFHACLPKQCHKPHSKLISYPDLALKSISHFLCIS